MEFMPVDNEESEIIEEEVIEPVPLEEESVWSEVE